MMSAQGAGRTYREGIKRDWFAKVAGYETMKRNATVIMKSVRLQRIFLPYDMNGSLSLLVENWKKCLDALLQRFAETNAKHKPEM